MSDISANSFSKEAFKPSEQQQAMLEQAQAVGEVRKAQAAEALPLGTEQGSLPEATPSIEKAAGQLQPAPLKEPASTVVVSGASEAVSSSAQAEGAGAALPVSAEVIAPLAAQLYQAAETGKLAELEGLMSTEPPKTPTT